MSKKASEETGVLKQGEQWMSKNLQLPLTVEAEAEVGKDGVITDSRVRWILYCSS